MALKRILDTRPLMGPRVLYLLIFFFSSPMLLHLAPDPYHTPQGRSESIESIWHFIISRQGGESRMV